MGVMGDTADNDQSALLRSLVPLNALSDECLGQLISAITIEKVAKGDYVFREGDTDHQHIYLLEGRVSLLSGQRPVDSVESGTNTARFALAHQWPRKFSARADGRLQLVRIDSRTLSDLLVRTQSQSYRVSELDTDSSSDWMSRVLQSRVFEQIPASNIQNVLLRMEQMEVQAGAVVIRQGDPGDYYFVIVRGTANVARSVEGQERQLAHMGPGDSFGEDALVAGGTRGGTVTMNSPGTLMRLNKDDFLELIKRPLVRSVSFAEGQKRAEQGAIWLDVRSTAKYAQDHIDGALNIPLTNLRTRCSELDPKTEYLVYGEQTDLGALGAFQLRERGLEVFVLDGGMTALREQGLHAAQSAPEVDDTPEELPLPTARSATDDSSPPANEFQAGDGLQQRVGELEQRLKDTQARYHKALYQRVSELRILKQALDNQKTENKRLKLELEQTQAANLATHGTEKQGLEATERNQLKAQIQSLQEELDEVQDVLQEASAEESSHQWARLRLEKQIASLESTLHEQQDINRVLREESEQTMRRLEDMREQIVQLESTGTEGAE